MNGYIVSLICVLVIFLVVLLIRAFQRHDPPRQHHWPEGLDAGDGSAPPDSSGAGGKSGDQGAR